MGIKLPKQGWEGVDDALVLLLFIVSVVSIGVVLLTPREGRSDREKCNDQSSTHWFCETDVVYVPALTDAGTTYTHRETRDVCTCRRGW
jgi:hypothetical protein